MRQGEHKHRIAEDVLADHQVLPGVFLILVARAPATVWDITHTPGGAVSNLAKKQAFVNHYSFHIWDTQWGHVTIKMSGHPPFAAQVILNGHEFVGCQAQHAGIEYCKERNCFTEVPDPAELARIADTFVPTRGGRATAGRLRTVDLHRLPVLRVGQRRADRSGFRYDYSVYQVEYSRNLLFRSGARMDRMFDTVLDRTRTRLDIPVLRTLFGAKQRPGRAPFEPSMQLAAVIIEKPRYDLTLFKVHFGLLTLKGYTKGEHVLRFEAITHNTRQLGCGRVLTNSRTSSPD